MRKEAEAKRRAEDQEHVRQEAEAKRQAEERARLREGAQEKKRAEEEARKREEAERQRRESEAKNRAEGEERARQQAEAKKQVDEVDTKRRRDEAETPRRLTEGAERQRQFTSATSKIFVNYRRGDDPGYTQSLYFILEVEFGQGNLFMDVEGHIKPGDDFVEILNEQISGAGVVLIVIGPRWLDLLSARKGDPHDFNLIEIEAAIAQGKRVIPVLVGGASMPRADSLPKSIQSLAWRQAVRLSVDRFRSDCLDLIAAMKEMLHRTPG